MKFLTIPRLQSLTSALNHVDCGDVILHCRVECYSCKAAGTDKRLGKQLERQWSTEITNTTSPSLSPTMSPLGPITEAQTRKLLLSLITTMNASFPDYDFSNLRPEQFSHELSIMSVIYECKTLFLQSLEAIHSGITCEFINAISETIDLSTSELYVYNPDYDGDIDSGKLWSKHYFLYNRKDKKVLFITANAVSKLHALEEDDDLDEVETMNYSSTGEGDDNDFDLHYDSNYLNHSTSDLVIDGSEFSIGPDQSALKLTQTQSLPVNATTAAQQTSIDSPSAMTRHSSVGVDDAKKRRRKAAAVTSSKGTAPEKRAKKAASKKGSSRVVEVGSDDEQSSERGGRSLLTVNQSRDALNPSNSSPNLTSIASIGLTGA